MIEIIGKIRDATPEEIERFQKIQKKLADTGNPEQKRQRPPSYEDRNS